MTSLLACRRAARGLVVGVALATTAAALAQEPASIKGRTLVDALRTLQDEGLRIVFASTIVTPDLRVTAEPRGATPRQRLDDLLAPHGLEARDGPRDTIQIVRASRRPADSPRPPRAAGTIEGRVVNARTGAPLAEAAVRVEGGSREVRTDGAGQFHLRPVGAGSRTVRATAAGFVAVMRAVRVAADATASIELRLPPLAAVHTEHLTVRGPRPSLQDGIAARATLDRRQWEQLHAGLADHPVRAVQAMPRVTAVDDFQSEFAVRGSPFRHIGFVVDGVATPWLQHAARARGATGSLSMLTGYVLEDATLRAGAYPRRHGDRLGAELELTIREGSRTDTRLRGAIGGPNATMVGEGPLGESARGSWLVAARQSYLEWPGEGQSSRPVFGFADGLAKLVFDVGPGQQVAFSVMGGRSNVDGEDNLAPNQLGDGTNDAVVLNLAWRSMLGSSAVLTQRAHVVRHRFANRHQGGFEWDRGSNEEVSYRGALLTATPFGLLEAGGEVSRAASRYEAPAQEARAALSAVEPFAGAAWQRAGYAHLTWGPSPGVTVSPGLRVTTSTLLSRPTVARWVLGEWAFRPQWTVSASAGVSHQPPELWQGSAAGGIPLAPERARHVDIALEHRVTPAVRWQLTLFDRREADVLRPPDLFPRVEAGRRIDPVEPRQFANALRGSARGVELVLERRSPGGLSGWASYSFGTARHTDAERGEAFWADFDQRHALNLFGAYRLNDRTSVGATFRAGSNFPIPGYLAWRDDQLLVAERRNGARLPAYARLDLRAERRLTVGRPLTLFAEVLNVLNRTNYGLANGSVLATGRAVGFTDTLFPRRVSAGVVVEF